jgi:rubredoxin
MSFKCENCGKAQEVGTQPVKMVTKTRKKEYPERWKQVPHGKPIKIDEGGKGWEIVREVMLCPSCHMAQVEFGG